MAEECHPLLTTDEPESNKVIAWAKTYEGARVVYMQFGHDHFAYENPSFQQILRAGDPVDGAQGLTRGGDRGVK